MSLPEILENGDVVRTDYGRLLVIKNGGCYDYKGKYYSNRYAAEITITAEELCKDCILSPVCNKVEHTIQCYKNKRKMKKWRQE